MNKKLCHFHIQFKMTFWCGCPKNPKIEMELHNSLYLVTSYTLYHHHHHHHHHHHRRRHENIGWLHFHLRITGSAYEFCYSLQIYTQISHLGTTKLHCFLHTLCFWEYRTSLVTFVWSFQSHQRLQDGWRCRTWEVGGWVSHGERRTQVMLLSLTT